MNCHNSLTWSDSCNILYFLSVFIIPCQSQYVAINSFVICQYWLLNLSFTSFNLELSWGCRQSNLLILILYDVTTVKPSDINPIWCHRQSNLLILILYDITTIKPSDINPIWYHQSNLLILILYDITWQSNLWY